MSSNNLISERYASALYELSMELNNVDIVQKDLKFLKKMIDDNKKLNLLIKSPLIASNDKLEIIEKLLANLETNKLTHNFLRIIANNKRFPYISSIISQFIKINTKKRGNIIADVTSADQLSDKQENDIKYQLQTILGDKLSLNFKVDKKIIGGLIVRLGSKMIDASLSSKINKLKVSMKGV